MRPFCHDHVYMITKWQSVPWTFYLEVNVSPRETQWFQRSCRVRNLDIVVGRNCSFDIYCSSTDFLSLWTFICIRNIRDIMCSQISDFDLQSILQHLLVSCWISNQILVALWNAWRRQHRDVTTNLNSIVQSCPSFFSCVLASQSSCPSIELQILHFCSSSDWHFKIDFE